MVQQEWGTGWQSRGSLGSYPNISTLIAQCLCHTGGEIFLMSLELGNGATLSSLTLLTLHWPDIPLHLRLYAQFFTLGKMLPRLILLVVPQVAGLESRMLQISPNICWEREEELLLCLPVFPKESISNDYKKPPNLLGLYIPIDKNSWWKTFSYVVKMIVLHQINMSNTMMKVTQILKLLSVDFCHD